MANEPRIFITGNTTADPELRYTNNGTPVANITIATTPRTKNGTQWDNGETMFFRATAWGTLAENITETLTKGTRIHATGRLTITTYTRNDGTQGISNNITLDSIAPSLDYATATVMRNTTTTPATSTPASHDPAGNLAHLDTNPPF